MGGHKRHPFGGMNHGNRRAPGNAAALIGRRRVGVIMVAAFGEVAAGGRVRMSARRRIMRMALRRRVIVPLRSRARMARPAACREGKRDGECKDDRQTAFHASETIRAS